MKLGILLLNIFSSAWMLLSGCSSPDKQGKSPKIPPVAVFECVNLLDRITLRTNPNIEREVVFDQASDHAAVQALYSLKRDIAAGTSDKGPRQLNLLLVGYFTGEIVKSTAEHNDPESEKAAFRMLGWYIKVPFYEYIQAPEGEDTPSPKLRDKLLESDFDVPIKPVIRSSNQGGKHYGIGQIDSVTTN